MGQSPEKTLIIAIDSFDFDDAYIIVPYNKASVGLLNIKTGRLYKGNDMENFFMTMASGRRVGIEKGLFKGVEKVGNQGLHIIGYDNIQKNLKENYSQIYPSMIFLGEVLKAKGIGYIGNDESSLLAADKDGNIRYGENHIIYEHDWVKSNIDNIFEKTNIMIISYNIKNKQERIELLRRLISDYENVNMIAFSKKSSSFFK